MPSDSSHPSQPGDSGHPSASGQSSDPQIEQTRLLPGREAGAMVGHYRLIERIGAGGMAEVYRAHDTQLNRQVAIKFLPRALIDQPELKERLRREAEAAASLSHPNIITIHELGEHEGRPYIVMECVEGQTLTSLLESSHGKLSTERILDLAVQMADAFAAAHRAGVIHRDIKPSNVLIDAQGRVKILDFGLAKLEQVPQLTQHGRTMGTPLYMSPEQTRGDEVDRRSDVFSFGLVLYELLTGHHPFKRSDEPSTLYSIVHEEPQPLPQFRHEISGDFEQIVRKALEKEKEDRYQTFDELLEDLRREKRLTDSREAAGTPHFARARRRRRSRSAAVVAATVLVGAALLTLLTRNWSIEFRTDNTAVAADNSIAVTYFENVVAPEDRDKHGRMIAGLLTTDLSQSSSLSVTSRQRLADLVKQVTGDDDADLDRSNASEVAERANVRWMLSGEILQTSPRWVVTSEIVDVTNGAIIASQRASTEADEDLFDVIDELSAAIRSDLALAMGGPIAKEEELADVTTTSPEAYNEFLDGWEALEKFYRTEAREKFERAAEIDSTYAMAYYGLAQTTEGEEKKQYAELAMQHIDKADDVEQLYIRSLDAAVHDDMDAATRIFEQIAQEHPDEKWALYALGSHAYMENDYGLAIDYLRRVIELDPYFKLAHNMLAYTYRELGDFEKSIAAINKYIEIAPGEANPYDSRADIYLHFGQTENAILSYEKAIEVKSDFWPSVQKCGQLQLMLGDYEAADRRFRRMLASDEGEVRSVARALLALGPMARGRFDEALEILARGKAADELEESTGFGVRAKYALEAFIHAERGQWPQAATAIRAFVDRARDRAAKEPYALEDLLVYYTGMEGDLARAEQLAEEYRERLATLEKLEPKTDFGYESALGHLEIIRGDLDQARVHLERASAHAPRPLFHVEFMLGRVQLEQGELGGAVQTLEKLERTYTEDRAFFPTYDVRAHYMLGRAYEASGWNGKAIEQYETYLGTLGESPEALEAIADARERLSRLRS